VYAYWLIASASFRSKTPCRLRDNTGFLLDEARFHPSARAVSEGVIRISSFQFLFSTFLQWGEGVPQRGSGIETPPFHGTRYKAFLWVKHRPHRFRPYPTGLN
jgi:hypothetical protein